MKMIGVSSDCWRVRISAAVSKPSMIGMRTSSRMTAKSCAITQRSASSPDSASTIMWPSGRSTALSASRLAALSSTMRIGTVMARRPAPSAAPRPPAAAESGHRALAGDRTRASRAADARRQPGSDRGDQLLGVDRLGDVVVGARVETALSFAGHDLARHRDDRDRPELVEGADRAHRVVAVHARHHDVGQHQVDRGGLSCEERERGRPALGDRHLGAAAFEQRGEREHVAEVVVDHEDAAPLERPIVETVVSGSGRTAARGLRRVGRGGPSVGRTGGESVAVSLVAPGLVRSRRILPSGRKTVNVLPLPRRAATGVISPPSSRRARG